MDARTRASTTATPSPLRYLHSLARRDGLRLWGENTGDNSADDLRRCAALVDDLGMAGMFWMGADDLGDGDNARLEDYADVVAT